MSYSEKCLVLAALFFVAGVFIAVYAMLSAGTDHQLSLWWPVLFGVLGFVFMFESIRKI